MRTKILLGLALLVAVPAFFSSKKVLERPTDFLSFYCAGRMVALRENPYLTQPLWDCERTALPAGDPQRDKMLVPAPLPPYALAFFSVFAPLPFTAARVLWMLLSALLIAMTAELLARTMKFPLWVPLAALVPSEAAVSMLLGQTVPLVVFALSAATVAVRNNKNALAAEALGFAAIEPHVVLPAFLALFAFLPSMRRPLAVACAVLAAISVVAVGPAVCFQYFAQVLPLHARADISNYEFQYSLTSVLWMFGVAPDRAIALGVLSYCVAVVAGVVLSARLSRRFNDTRFLIVIPTAIALIGGMFVHAQQLAVAIPAALLLASYLPSRRSQTAMLAVSVFTLSLPWILLPAFPAVTALFPRVPPSTAPLRVLYTKPGDLAEVGWAHESEATAILFPPNPPVEIAFKLPGWLGLLFLAAVAAQMRAGVRSKPRAVP